MKANREKFKQFVTEQLKDYDEWREASPDGYAEIITDEAVKLFCQPDVVGQSEEIKVQNSAEVSNDGNNVLAGRCYQIDFGNHLRCKIKVTDNGIEVEGAMNGWGDGVPLSEVVVAEVQ